MFGNPPFIPHATQFFPGLYFYVLDGKVYWGRHQSLPPYRQMFDWVFRSKPMVPERWYYSRGQWFSVRFEVNGYLEIFVREVGKREKWTHEYLQEGYCYFIHNRMKTTLPVSCHVTARSDFANAFRNRQNEYADCHFLPMSKRHQRACR